MRISKAIVLMALAFSLIGCGNSEINKGELQELREYTTLGKHSIADIENDLIKVVNLVYSPMYSEDLDRAYEILSEYASKNLVKTFKERTNEYKDSKNVIENLTIRLGSPINQLDRTYKFLVTFTIKNGNIEQDMAIEFIATELGVIVDYDVWYTRA